MHRIFAHFQDTYQRWQSALTQNNTQGVFSMVHHMILWVLGGLATIHIVFMAYFTAITIEPMIYINIASVIYYLACCCYKIKHDKSHDLMIALIVVEVCAHALAATYYIGWDSGFAIYLMDVSVILAIITSTSAFSRIAAMLTLSFALLACDFYFSNHTPLYTLDKTIIDATRMFNYASAMIALGLAATGYQYLLAVANQSMTKLANEDQLTGQMNRRAMIDKSELVIAQCTASRVPLCAAIGDLDHFKHINDNYGHAVGDEVLVAVSSAIKHTNRSGDISARWGGEEFVWLLPNTSAQQAKQALDRLRLAVEALQPKQADNNWQATVSIGFTEIQVGENFDQAISRADSALYRAKQNGRNRVEYQRVSEAQGDESQETSLFDPITTDQALGFD